MAEKENKVAENKKEKEPGKIAKWWSKNKYSILETVCDVSGYVTIGCIGAIGGMLLRDYQYGEQLQKLIKAGYLSRTILDEEGNRIVIDTVESLNWDDAATKLLKAKK